jgi:GWxTD domain-containing protein
MSSIIRPFILFFFIVLHVLPGVAQQPITMEMRKNAYNPQAEIFLRHTHYRHQDSVFLYMQLRLNEKNAAKKHYTFRAEMVQDVSQNKRGEIMDSTRFGIQYLGQDEDNHFFRFAFPYQTPATVLLLTISSQLTGLDYYLPINLERFINPGMVIFDTQSGLPVLDPYINKGREVEVRVHSLGMDLHAFVYREKFPPAIPPMVTDPPKTDKGMQVDSTFILFRGQPLQFKAEGLYLIQADTNQPQGLALRVQGSYYPQLVELKDLIPPLIYITNREERALLDKSYNDKKSFDKFWLDLSGSPERARKIIRNYYQRVEEANMLFTTFKEGWQTDRGMIYTLYGPPDDVVADAYGEEWLYTETNDLPRMRFRFVHSPNIFAPNNYVLVRSKRLDTNWFRVVDLWRKARIGK